ncbi:hypothetical protein CHS0354_020073 [Potamilus streckersoni]|uniref:Uncharacterized protein n=1 Tax=Potamilus streckersoni TaxID=2493646 RepID=A0AAE0SCA1_9BIVA|nr:hypothetical protein CHS0354_020073 [Potamilus streckersoni]
MTQQQFGPDSTQSLCSLSSKINDLGHNNENKPLKRNEAGNRGNNGHAEGLGTETKRQRTNYKRQHEDVYDGDEDLYSHKKRQQLDDHKCATNEMRHGIPGHEKDDWTSNSLSQSLSIPVNR